MLENSRARRWPGTRRTCGSSRPHPVGRRAGPRRQRRVLRPRQRGRSRGRASPARRGPGRLRGARDEGRLVGRPARGAVRRRTSGTGRRVGAEHRVLGRCGDQHHPRLSTMIAPGRELCVRARTRSSTSSTAPLPTCRTSSCRASSAPRSPSPPRPRADARPPDQPPDWRRVAAPPRASRPPRRGRTTRAESRPQRQFTGLPARDVVAQRETSVRVRVRVRPPRRPPDRRRAAAPPTGASHGLSDSSRGSRRVDCRSARNFRPRPPAGCPPDGRRVAPPPRDSRPPRRGPPPGPSHGLSDSSRPGRRVKCRSARNSRPRRPAGDAHRTGAAPRPHHRAESRPQRQFTGSPARDVSARTRALPGTLG